MNKKFVAVRYFMVPLEESLFYKPLSLDARKALFVEALLQNQTHITEKGVQLKIRGIHNDNEIYYGKLGRYSRITMDQDIQTDFEPQEQDGFYTIRFLCNINQQIIVLEMNSNFESDLERICRWLEAITNKVTIQKEYSVSFRPIVPKGDFWYIIENASKVFSVTLVLDSPNLFMGNNSGETALRQWQSIFHQNKLTVKFDNKKGNLNIPQEEVGPYVNYADQGGGHWVVSVFDKISKRRKRINSAQVAASTYIESEDKTDDQTLMEAFRNLEEHDEYSETKD